jgi:hypothetical protein
MLLSRRHWGNVGLAVSLLPFAGVMVAIPGCWWLVPNQPPSADAGADQTVVIGASVLLDGAGSSDPDEDVLEFSWVQIAGTGVALYDADTATPSFTAPETVAELTFRLMVTDGRGGGDADTVSVTVALPPPNPPPEARAGDDQTVATGARVTLDGSGSSDPDEDSLTFTWTQLSGTLVSLDAADTASPTFVAPALPTVLTFQLTVDDGNGGTDTDAVEVTVVHPGPPAAGRLFVANMGGNRITGYDQPGAMDGNVVPSTCLAGPQTQLAAPIDLLVAPDGSLLVANTDTSTIAVYNDALNATGDLAPERVVQPRGLGSPCSLAMNPDADLLFVSTEGSDPLEQLLIAVFDRVSTPAFNGDVTPAWVNYDYGLNTPWDVHWTADDDLYATTDCSRSTFVVFSDASTGPNPDEPSREVCCNGIGNRWGLFVDANDTLYVVSYSYDQVFIFYNAAALDGTYDPDLTLTVEGAGDLMFIAVDSTGTGYITDRVLDAIYCYDNLATRAGTVPPDRTIQGAQTQLDQPFGMFLLED